MFLLNVNFFWLSSLYKRRKVIKSFGGIFLFEYSYWWKLWMKFVINSYHHSCHVQFINLSKDFERKKKIIIYSWLEIFLLMVTLKTAAKRWAWDVFRCIFSYSWHVMFVCFFLEFSFIFSCVIGLMDNRNFGFYDRFVSIHWNVGFNFKRIPLVTIINEQIRWMHAGKYHH